MCPLFHLTTGGGGRIFHFNHQQIRKPPCAAVRPYFVEELPPTLSLITGFISHLVCNCLLSPWRRRRRHNTRLPALRVTILKVHNSKLIFQVPPIGLVHLISHWVLSISQETAHSESGRVWYLEDHRVGEGRMAAPSRSKTIWAKWITANENR